MVGLVALGAVPHGGVAVPPHLGAAGAHDALVYRGLHAVVLLDVQLGEGVVVEHGRLADVTERGGVHDVPGGFFGEREYGGAAATNSSFSETAKQKKKVRRKERARSNMLFRKVLEYCCSWTENKSG